jgi:hypothetical protein
VTFSLDISAEMRGVLREGVFNHLETLDDLRMAFKAEEWGRAERLGIEFGDELRLMKDLGWGDSVRSPIQLTMAPSRLRCVLGRLRSDAEALLEAEVYEEVQERLAAEADKDRIRRLATACERLLSSVVDQGA